MTIDASLNNRLRRVERTRERMRKNGVVYRVGPDGLIRARPRLIRPQFPLMGALTVAVLFITFKSLLFAQLGAGNYATKVADLRSGSAVEQIGAVLLQEDRITVAVAGYIKRYVF